MRTSSPFDTMAVSYDEDFTFSATGSLQRERVWSILTPLLTQLGTSLKILEINCGTGHDAIRLSEMGHQVTATDASEKMIGMAREKLNDITLPSIPEFITCSFEQLPGRFAGGQFDLVISDFGGLNCVDGEGLRKLSRDLHQLTRPGGVLLLVVMGRCCLSEIFHYGIRGKFRKAFRRLGGPVDFGTGDRMMKVFYHSPSELKQFFSPYFQMTRKDPVGLFIPPSYLEGKYARHGARLKKLNELEQRFGHPSLSSFGDHYCAIFKKKEGSG